MEVDHVYMSPKQYHNATGGQLGIEEIKRLCRIGRIPCEMTKNGFYKIKVYKDNCVDKKEYDRVVRENIELKTLLKNINNLSNIG